ncbi:MAG TPA: uL13 family ribosomal protein, partial [Actinomycetota bacterium]|nr:uL13 family ribosomal protein [Actinomycetota bacterium]
MKTYSPRPRDIERRWYVIDASDAVLGRLASEAAAILSGKHKPIFAPHMDTGDHVIVINAKR